MNDNIVSKMAMSVSEMARAVGLSRARFYRRNRRGTFPTPDQEPMTKRPFYNEEKQLLCLEIRRRNCGIDGKPILFYSRRRDCGSGKQKPTKPRVLPKDKNLTALLDGLKALGLTTATAAQVEEMVTQIYPNGREGIDQGEVLKAVFLEIRRRNSGGSESGK